MLWYLKVLSQYVDFATRASRREFWWFVLIHFLIIVLLVPMEIAFGFWNMTYGFGYISTPYLVLTLLPAIAVAVRRLHDTGRSGWWLLINVLPAIGSLILLFFYCQKTEDQTNRFGPSPKAPSTRHSGSAEQA